MLLPQRCQRMHAYKRSRKIDAVLATASLTRGRRKFVLYGKAPGRRELTSPCLRRQCLRIRACPILGRRDRVALVGITSPPPLLRFLIFLQPEGTNKRDQPFLRTLYAGTAPVD